MAKKMARNGRKKDIYKGDIHLYTDFIKSILLINLVLDWTKMVPNNNLNKLLKINNTSLLLSYPCNHFYFDIKFSNRPYSNKKRRAWTLLI